MFRIALMQNNKKIKTSGTLDNSTLILVIIWLLSAFILTKSFTGLMLNMYFKHKSVALVTDLKDVYQQKHLAISAVKVMFDNIYLPIMHKNERDNVKARYRFYRGDPIQNRSLIDDILLGKTILLANTKSRKLFFEQNSILQDYLTVSRYKYQYNFDCFFVKKRLPFKNSLVFM